MTELSVVIPAFNEEDRIVPTLKNTLSYLGRQVFPSEVVVVSDGSTDGTCRVVRGFAHGQGPVVRTLEYHPNRGKGHAVRYGMLRASGRVILFMDADYSVPIEALEPAMDLLRQGADIAIASRAVAGSRILHRQSKVRQWCAKCYTFVQNRHLGIDYPDTQCGFKIFTRQAVRDLFSRQKLDSVIFDAEILWLAARRGYRVAQFPVQWVHAADSRIRYDSPLKFLFVFQELFRIKRLHRREFA